MKQYLAIMGLIFLAACNNNDKPVIDTDIEKLATPEIAYSIIAEYPHDTSAFTQGLQIHNGKLYEGTGMEKESSLRIVDIKTGKVEKKYTYTDDVTFGEGINVFKDKIYQLTWKNHVVYIFDTSNIDKPIKTLPWPYEGWGITNNGTDLIISDGSANLYFVDPENFKIKNTIAVSDNSGNIESLNELEYIDGFIFANVWGKNIIIKIDPISGHVIGKISLPDLDKKYFANQIVPQRTDVLNGIAYDSVTKKIYITGKRWPKLFELKLN